MATKKPTEKLIEKKRRGRPKLSDEEKKARAAARKAKKKTETERKKELKAVKKETVPEIVEKTKTETEGPEGKCVSQKILKAASAVPVPENAKKLLNPTENPTDTEVRLEITEVSREITDTFRKQENIVRDKIESLEHENSLLKTRLDKLESREAELVSQRDYLKVRNNREENLLFKEELVLLEFNFEGSEYRADSVIPLWVRELVSRITQKPDELVVLQKINGFKYKIQNRSEQLNKIEKELSDITTVTIYHESVIENLDKMVSGLRDLRSTLGDDFRELRYFFKRNQVKIDRAQMMQRLEENINSVVKKTNEINKKLEEGLAAFNDYQKKSLRLAEDNSLEISIVSSEEVENKK